MGYFLISETRLVDADLRARGGAASERTFSDFLEADDAFFFSVNREITAKVCARASNFRATSLADEDFACIDFLATKTLDAEARTGVVVDVLG